MIIDDNWILASLVVPDFITLAKGSLVGENSNFFYSSREYEVVNASPAKLIKKRK